MTLTYLTESVDLRDLPPLDLIFGNSPQMAATRRKIARVAATSIPVLLEGESGTGKEIIAKVLHFLSDRSERPWVKVACPAIPQSLIESELFGYEKGSFTGAHATKRGRVEMAHSGTLFLDEIDSLDPGVQVKLLQLLQDGSFMRIGGQESKQVNTRLISAARGNLRRLVTDGIFRPDLYFRINVVTIPLLPLRERIVDLPMMIDYFLDRHSRAFCRDAKPLSRDMLRLMQSYDWPGNIRQLENMIRSYVLIGSEDSMAADLIPANVFNGIQEIDLSRPISLKELTKSAIQGLERQVIHKVLRSNGGNRRKTAQWLNISYRSLLYKLRDVQTGRQVSVPSEAKGPAPALIWSRHTQSRSESAWGRSGGIPVDRKE